MNDNQRAHLVESRILRSNAFKAPKRVLQMRLLEPIEQLTRKLAYTGNVAGKTFDTKCNLGRIEAETIIKSYSPANDLQAAFSPRYTSTRYNIA